MTTKANTVTQETEDKVGSPTNPSVLPSGILPTDQIAVVEKDSPDSGYLLPGTNGQNATRYLVREGSALTGPPWNMSVGVIQGGYANPPMSDALLAELGLNRDEFEKLGKTSETKDAVEGAVATPDDFDPDDPAKTAQPGKK